jgi:hypothetical protein
MAAEQESGLSVRNLSIACRSAKLSIASRTKPASAVGRPGQAYSSLVGWHQIVAEQSVDWSAPLLPPLVLDLSSKRVRRRRLFGPFRMAPQRIGKLVG